MLIIHLLMPILEAMWKALRRVVDVWRTEHGESHTATEYADALLFPPEHADAADPSLPLSIRDP
jgi:hypothetical protein